MYKLTNTGVLRLTDNVSVFGPDQNNPDWISYEAWVVAGGIPQPIDMPMSIDDAKSQRVSIINDECERMITNGFYSSALGAIHKYDSNIEDQINLIGAVIAAGVAVTVEYKCYQNCDTTCDKVWVAHSPQHMKQVYMDGMIYKVTQLKKATYYKDLIAAATTIDDVLLIEWSE